MAGIATGPEVAADVGIGIGATLLSKMLALRTWTVQNQDTLERIEGQFPAEETTRGVGANWSELNSLNRQNPILQWVSGKADTLSIQSRFFRRDLSDESPQKKLDKLISWTRRDQRKGRPPILIFWIGDGTVVSMNCILENISDIKTSTPSFFGGIREAKFTLNFKQYTAFSLDAKEVNDTRYHRTKQGQYYEIIAQEEYGNAMLGDVIRKQDYQIGKALLKPGDIVKLPAIEGVRTQKVTQQSIILAGAYDKRVDSQQRQLRIAHFKTRTITRNVFFLDTPQPIMLPFASGIFDSTFDDTFE